MTARAGGALVLTAALLIAGCGGGHGQPTSVGKNLAVLRQLPVFPGARHVGTSSSPYYPQDDEHAPPAGDTTGFTYAAPAGTTAKRLVHFYEGRLTPAWRCRRERLPIMNLDRPHREGGAVVNLSCSRSKTAITIDTLNLPGQFEVVAKTPR